MSAILEGKKAMKDFTPEQRLQFQEAARQKRLQQIEFAEKHLRNQFADDAHWRELASKHGIRLPAWYVPGTDLKHIRRALRKLGMGSQGMRECTGFARAEDFAAANPNWPAYALIGLLLEHL